MTKYSKSLLHFPAVKEYVEKRFSKVELSGGAKKLIKQMVAMEALNGITERRVREIIKLGLKRDRFLRHYLTNEIGGDRGKFNECAGKLSEIVREKECRCMVAIDYMLSPRLEREIKKLLMNLKCASLFWMGF